MDVSRRHFFFGTFALSACGRRSQTAAESLVTITRAASYDCDLESILRETLAAHRANFRGKRVLLKPNLVEFDSTRPVNTHPKIVAATRAAMFAAGASEVLIAEGPGHRRATWEMAEAAGYFDAVPQFEPHFTDLNLDDVTAIPLCQPHSELRRLYLPNTALRADVIVSIAKMKTHHWAGATLSMKNLFGLVPGGVYGWPKNVLHWAGIDESIADIYRTFPSQFAIVDGIEAMEGNGPVLGTGVAAGVIVAGGHPPSVDRVCCRIMRIDPERIGYLRFAATRERARSIRIEGAQLDAVAREFALIPELSHLRTS